MRFTAFLFAANLFLHAFPAQCQQLAVQPEPGEIVTLGRAEIEALPHVTVTMNGHDGQATFEGVALRAVLEKSGVTFGETLASAWRRACSLKLPMDIAPSSLYLNSIPALLISKSS